MTVNKAGRKVGMSLNLSKNYLSSYYALIKIIMDTGPKSFDEVQHNDESIVKATED